MADTKFFDTLKNKEVTIDDYGQLDKEGKNKIVLDGSYKYSFFCRGWEAKVNIQKSDFKLLESILILPYHLKNYFDNQ